MESHDALARVRWRERRDLYDESVASGAPKFAFVSCQNVNQGAQNAYRRIIHEDERTPLRSGSGSSCILAISFTRFVWYPEDRPQCMYDRRLRDIVRYKNGEKISDFHIATTVEDYRAVYRAYLRGPDPAGRTRARWPFIRMWDNHEFSWLGWQSLQEFNGQTRPAQTRKVAANQAWFEYQPARVANRVAHRWSASIRRTWWTHPLSGLTTTGWGKNRTI